MVDETFVFPFEKLEVYRLALELADFVFQLLESIQFESHDILTVDIADKELKIRPYLIGNPIEMGLDG